MNTAILPELKTKYKHTIIGTNDKGKAFELIQHTNNTLTITKSIIMYFTKHNYMLLAATRHNNVNPTTN